MVGRAGAVRVAVMRASAAKTSTLLVEGQGYRRRTLALSPTLRVNFFEVANVDAALEEAIRRDGPAPYGAVAWGSSVAVARALFEVGALAGRRVVDVGTGCGVVALVAARLGAEVLALDHDELALRLTSEAAKEQGLDVTTRRFDVAGSEALPEADVMVFADLLYEEELAEAVARRVVEARALGAEVYVADPGRVFRARFLAALSAAGTVASFRTVAVHVPGAERSSEVGLLVLGGGG